MVRDFYFFRHGQTDYNAQNKWQGSGIDALLNQKGQEQIWEVARKSEDFMLTRLYSSPLLRAVQTANAISQINGDMPVVVMRDFRECYFGECEGLTFTESRQKYGDDFVDTILFPTRENWKIYFPQGESKKDVFERVMKALRKIMSHLSENRRESIGVVCHAGVISALQCGLDLKNVLYDNCSVLHLAYDTANLKHDAQTLMWKQMPC